MNQLEVHLKRGKFAGVGAVLALLALVVGLAGSYLFMGLEHEELISVKGLLLQVGGPVLFVVLAGGGWLFLSLSFRAEPLLVIRDDGLWLRDYGGLLSYEEIEAAEVETHPKAGRLLRLLPRSLDSIRSAANLHGKLSLWLNELAGAPALSISENSTEPGIDETLTALRARGVAGENQTSAQPISLPGLLPAEEAVSEVLVSAGRIPRAVLIQAARQATQLRQQGQQADLIGVLVHTGALDSAGAAQVMQAAESRLQSLGDAVSPQGVTTGERQDAADSGEEGVGAVWVILALGVFVCARVAGVVGALFFGLWLLSAHRIWKSHLGSVGKVSLILFLLAACFAGYVKFVGILLNG